VPSPAPQAHQAASGGYGGSYAAYQAAAGAFGLPSGPGHAQPSGSVDAQAMQQPSQPMAGQLQAQGLAQPALLQAAPMGVAGAASAGPPLQSGPYGQQPMILIMGGGPNGQPTTVAQQSGGAPLAYVAGSQGYAVVPDAQLAAPLQQQQPVRPPPQQQQQHFQQHQQPQQQPTQQPQAQGPRGARQAGGPLPADAASTLFLDNVPLNATKRELSHIFRPYPGFKASPRANAIGT
jgi:hypothetical protein